MIRVYLNDEVQEHPDFEPARSSGKGIITPKLSGIILSRTDGSWYYSLDEPADIIPERISGFVKFFSYRQNIPIISKREAGVYRSGTAEAEVHPNQSDGGRMTTWILITAQKMEDLRALLRMIMAGSIRPEESWEGPQGGMSRAELEAELGRILLRLKQTRLTLEQAHRELEMTTTPLLETLRADLTALWCEFSRTGRSWWWWPFCICLKATMEKRIEKILDKFPD